MSNYIFLFDLDSTITRKEILPEISKMVNKEKEMRKLTEETMNGVLPFKQSFLNRVELLKDTDVSLVNKMVGNIPLNESIVEFIKNNRERCYVVTGNLDIWISSLIKKIGLENHCYSSKALVKNDKVEKVISVLDKDLTVRQFVQPIVSIGDGDNDSDMARLSVIAIGFGGVRNIAPSLLKNINFAFVDDKKCAEFLESLL